VEAEIIGHEQAHEEICIPAYAWRDRPEYFSYGLYSTGDIRETDGDTPQPLPAEASAYSSELSFASFLNETLRDELIALDDPRIVCDLSADVSALYEGGAAPVPSVVLLAGGPGIITASDPARNKFYGVILCLGALTINGAEITGTVMADGPIRFTGPAVFSADPDALFKIPLPDGIKKVLFDFLGLTNFTHAADGAVDIESILGRLAFDTEAENGAPGEIVIKNFDGAILSMIKSMKITD
jgi:hypothetical protein